MAAIASARSIAYGPPGLAPPPRSPTYRLQKPVGRGSSRSRICTHISALWRTGEPSSAVNPAWRPPRRNERQRRAPEGSPTSVSSATWTLDRCAAPPVVAGEHVHAVAAAARRRPRATPKRPSKVIEPRSCPGAANFVDAGALDPERVVDDRVDPGVLQQQRAPAGGVERMPERPDPRAVDVRHGADRAGREVAGGQADGHGGAGTIGWTGKSSPTAGRSGPPAGRGPPSPPGGRTGRGPPDRRPGRRWAWRAGARSRVARAAGVARRRRVGHRRAEHRLDRRGERHLLP